MGLNQSRLHSYRTRILAHQDFAAAKQTIADAVRHLAISEDRLYELFPQLRQGYVDNPLQQSQPQSPIVPPPSQISIQQRNGFSIITVTPPNLSDPPTAKLFQAILKQNPNLAQSPIVHKLQSSSNSAFDATGGVQQYPATSQLIITIPDTNALWRVSSSFDQVNFNPPSATERAIPI